MAKKRKTRERKKLADLRHNFQHSIISETFRTKLQPAGNNIVGQKMPAVTTVSYPYLIKDLQKTLMLTAVIIAFQLILFFIFKNHIIRIPGLIY